MTRWPRALARLGRAPMQEQGGTTRKAHAASQPVCGAISMGAKQINVRTRQASWAPLLHPAAHLGRTQSRAIPVPLSGRCGPRSSLFRSGFSPMCLLCHSHTPNRERVPDIPTTQRGHKVRVLVQAATANKGAEMRCGRAGNRTLRLDDEQQSFS
jgi:hypothetical protein